MRRADSPIISPVTARVPGQNEKRAKAEQLRATLPGEWAV